MATEILYSGQANLFLAATLNGMLHETLSDKTSLRSTMKNFGTLPAGSIANEIAAVSWGDAMSVDTENSGVTGVDLTSAVTTITVARYALKREATDIYDVAGGPRPGLQRMAQEMANAADITLTDMVCALFDNITAQVGTTGVALSVDTIYDAQFALIQALVPGPYHCVLHPDSFVEFQDSLRGEGGSAQWQAATADMLSIGDGRGYGHRGSWNGITFWTSDSVGTDATDFSGAMYGESAFGFIEAVPPSVLAHAGPGSFAAQTPAGAPIFVEFERNADKGNTLVVGNYYVGTAMIEQARGVEILSVD